ncbi:DoxX family protein [Hyalangium rubrum]|uniref:DoxX family protein n=1 Tax=Hyalangium rubrum TaxID=3103134 RepID=A0ABU5H601_9BACT|nr:DoxX family protein [Hyalangium sp. s54d21]MDY7228904.1 DoxX family protein [Hyalangium sp. s54d21]
MDVLAPIGRLLFSAIFITSGLNHFLHLQAMTGYAQSSGLPMPQLAVLASGVVLVVGGVCVLLGSFARLGAALIALFLLTSAFTMHRFWDLADAQLVQQQQVHFMKNLSMAGGALLLVYFGPGAFSLRRKKAEGRRTSFGVPLRHRIQE